MLGYLFTLIAVFAGAVKGFCSKKTSTIFYDLKNLTLLNVIRLAISAVIGFFFVLVEAGGFQGFVLDSKTFCICLFSAFASSFFIIVWLLCVRKSAYSTLSIFLILSSLVPMILSNIFWGEEISLFQIIGYFILLVSAVFMWIYSNSVKGKFKLFDAIMLFVIAILNGLSYLAQKWRTNEVKDVLSNSAFNFYTYAFGTIFLILFFLILCLIGLKKRKAENDEVTKEVFSIKKIFWYVLILSISLFLNSFFLTEASNTVPSAVMYPLNHGLGLILAMLIGHFFFSEKINRYSVIGICLALISFIFMVL